MIVNCDFNGDGHPDHNKYDWKGPLKKLFVRQLQLVRRFDSVSQVHPAKRIDEGYKDEFYDFDIDVSVSVGCRLTL